MKDYIHARINREDYAVLKELKRVIGQSVSTLVRRGLRLLYEQEVKKSKSALQVVGKLAGSLSSGIGDLSINKKHLKDYGK